MKLAADQLISLLSNVGRWKNTDLIADCPWCGHHEFYISLNDNHPFNCVRKKKCGETGNIYKLLDKLGRYDLKNIKPDIKWVSRVKETLLDAPNEHVSIDLSEIRLPTGFKRIYADEYLKNRGFKEADFNDYVIGYALLDRKLLNYVIFVIYQDFKPVATIARYKGSKKEIEEQERKTGRKILRYKNSESDFSKILGGYDELENNVTKTAILCEGLFDKKHTDDLLDLKSSNEMKCLYTFKCDISDEQLYRLQLKGVENIILLYDPDVISKIKDVAFRLSQYFNVKIGLIEATNENGELKDPAELNYEELINILNNLYLPLDFSLKKVQILKL